MHVTVAICTWNRARLLRQSLRSLRQLRVPRDATWDLVVVDNNCSDATPQVLREEAPGLPLRAVREPAAGLAHARNRAVAEARGDYVAWLDDDVLVDPGWLAAYVAAFRRHPEAVVFGGSAEVVFEGTPPTWFRDAMPVIGGIFGDLPRLEGPIVPDGPRLPFGVNMALRGDVQRRFPYDADLGRRGASLLANEDTEVIRAILAAGHSGVWVPDAAVQHVVAVERQSETYLRRWYEGYGTTTARLERGRGGGRRLLGRPLWAWKDAVLQELLYRATRPVAETTRWVTHLRRSRFARGVLRA